MDQASSSSSSSHHYLSASEFLQSGCMSKSVIVLQQEKNGDNNNNISSKKSHDSLSDSNGDRTKRRIENATRLALLIAQSFADFLHDDGNEDDEDDDDVGDAASATTTSRRSKNLSLSTASSLQLDDFYISFKHHQSSSSTTTTKSSSSQDDDTLQQGFFSNFDGQNQQAYQDFFNKMANRTCVKNVSPIFENDEDEDSNKDGGRIVLLGIDIHVSSSDDDGNNNNEGGSPQQQCQLSAASTASSVVVVVLSPMQILGKLLLSLFCFGKSSSSSSSTLPINNILEELLPRMSSPSHSPDYYYNNGAAPTHHHHHHYCEEGSVNSSEKSTKSLRVAKVTTFTRLVEHTHHHHYYHPPNNNSHDDVVLPISICRLLGDLLDSTTTTTTISEGKQHYTNEEEDLDYSLDDTVFASFDEVLQDLEKMSCQSEIFLHNPTNNSSVGQQQQQQLLMFGQKYHSRKEEVAILMKLASQIMDPFVVGNGNKLLEGGGGGGGGCGGGGDNTNNNNGGVRAAFVSGIAGSGKSKLLHALQNNLQSSSSSSCRSCSCWITIKAKFERSIQQASRSILSSMFNQIIDYLIHMKQSTCPADVAYSLRVSSAILLSVGHDGLVGLVDFLPSLTILFEDTLERSRIHSPHHGGEESDWQLVQSIIKILEAVLLYDESPFSSSSSSLDRRYMLICCDDMQWADKPSLLLISEILITIGEHPTIRNHILFVGLYRSNEIGDDHPLAIQHFHLQMSSSLDVTEIPLTSLTKEDVVDILMEEFRLPRRLVLKLADVVYKKTAGHAYFVVELLNSLLRDCIVTYSSDKYRYTWDVDRVNILPTGDTVAQLIAKNLNTLPKKLLGILQILSCFGTQTEDSLLGILEGLQEGIVSSIDTFVERGILDKAGPIVIFAHDLIQEAVYQSMGAEERQSLHLRLGKFLGGCVDDSSSSSLAPATTAAVTIDPVTTIRFGNLSLKDQVFYSGRNFLTSTLLSLACDQVNAAGPESIIVTCDDDDDTIGCCLKFAKWNLSSGQTFALQSNFSAALFYYSNGINFLRKEDSCWDNTFDQKTLCLDLHHGAVSSSFALGDADIVEMYAQQVIEHVPFEDSLEVQQMVLRSLAQSERHQECISRGIDILNKLGVCIPLAPPASEDILHAMASTAMLAAKYSSEEITRPCQETATSTTGNSTYAAVKIMDAFYVSTYATASPVLPLIACEMVKLSLQHGCCPEAALSFATVALYKIFLEDSYSGGRYWADLARKIIKVNPTKNKNSEIRVELILHLTIDIFFFSPVEISSKLIDSFDDAMMIGQVDNAKISLLQAWRFRLLGGYNLSLILQSCEERLENTAKHSKYSAKYMALDAILLTELTGKSINCFSVFGDSISSIDDLRSDAEKFKDSRWLHNFHMAKMLIAFWRGDYFMAEEHFSIASAYPSAKMPQILSIQHTFFGGLVALHLYRTMGGGQRLKLGKGSIEKLEKWAKHCRDVYESRYLLLQAEYSASIGDHDRAYTLYKSSIAAAKDHGNLHELALAFELLGNHHCSNKGQCSDSENCYTHAFAYYKQWGATAVAERLMRKQNLRMQHSVAASELQPGKSKHPRE